MEAGGGRRLIERLAAALLLSALASCSDGLALEEDGEGSVAMSPGAGWGVVWKEARTGQTWWQGGVTMCRTSPSVEPRLVSVEAVSVEGAVRLEGIWARTAKWGVPDRPADPDTHLAGLMRRPPDGLAEPRGYVVPTTCEDDRDPVGEIVVALTKTGETGGLLSGLRVVYRDGTGVHVFVTDFSFVLCGTGQLALVEPCVPDAGTSSRDGEA